MGSHSNKVRCLVPRPRFLASPTAGRGWGRNDRQRMMCCCRRFLLFASLSNALSRCSNSIDSPREVTLCDKQFLSV